MEQNQFITNPSHQKSKHLNFEERVVIQIRLVTVGLSEKSLAKWLFVNTVRNEYSCGKILLYNGKIVRYRSEDGQAQYNCGRKFLTLARE